MCCNAAGVPAYQVISKPVRPVVYDEKLKIMKKFRLQFLVVGLCSKISTRQ